MWLTRWLSLVSFLREVTIWIWPGSEGSGVYVGGKAYGIFIVLWVCVCTDIRRESVERSDCGRRGRAWTNIDGQDGLQHEGETEPVFCRQAVTMYIWMDVSGRVVCGNLWKLGSLG